MNENVKKILIFVSLILIIKGLFILYPFLSVPEYQNIQFNGNAEFIDFSGQTSVVKFNAYGLYLEVDEIVFNSVKNINIKNKEGITKIYNESSVQIQYNMTYQHLIPNAEIDMIFVNLTMEKNFIYDSISLYGEYPIYTKNIKSNRESYKVNFENRENITYPFASNLYFSYPPAEINYVIVGDKMFVDPEQISFVMDNESDIIVDSDNINLTAYIISDLKIISTNLSKLNLTQGEGALGLDNHKFEINSADYLYFEFLNQSNTLNIDDTKIKFNGFVDSAELNNENIIINEVSYWYKVKPESLFSGINALSVVVLVIITSWYALSTRSMLSEQMKNRKTVATEKKLEHVYSPINNATNEFKVKLMPLPIDRIPDIYDKTFNEFIEKVTKVDKNYGHLFDNQMQNYFLKMWESWIQYQNKKTFDDYLNLNGNINTFHSYVGIKIQEETEMLNNLQI